MAEVLVGSRELTVTVLNGKPLCVTEIKTDKKKLSSSRFGRPITAGVFSNVTWRVKKIKKK